MELKKGEKSQPRVFPKCAIFLAGASYPEKMKPAHLEMLKTRTNKFKFVKPFKKEEVDASLKKCASCWSHFVFDSFAKKMDKKQPVPTETPEERTARLERFILQHFGFDILGEEGNGEYIAQPAAPSGSST